MVEIKESKDVCISCCDKSKSTMKISINRTGSSHKGDNITSFSLCNDCLKTLVKELKSDDMNESEAIAIIKSEMKFHPKYSTFGEALALSLKALEKQIAKKPIEQIRLLGLDKGGKCPSCNKYINTCRYWMYCECGQKIDWSDIN